MATWLEVPDGVAALAAGVRTKGEYRCSGCGYGVTIYRELPRCPMCGAGSWEESAWTPLGREAPTFVAEVRDRTAS